MNPIAQTLLWCVVQVAAISVVAIVIAKLAGRRNPAAGVWCLRAGLAMALVVTLAAPAPLPGWFSGAETTTKVAQAQTSQESPTSPAPSDSEAELPAAAPVMTTPTSAPGAGEQADLASGLRLAFLRAVSREPIAVEESNKQGAESAAWSSAMWFAVFGCCTGILWFVVGGLSVRVLLSRSEPLEDPRVREMLDIVVAELSCRRPIRLREAELASAATVGFFRPVILLPSGWYEWTDEELHAVLGHEVAHVRANDFGATVFGQFIVAIHFFHPCVHWLTRRLRLTQELAADAAASEITRDRNTYATVLAGMALRENQHSNLWATQAFLPAPRTLLRRIEMLRDSKSLRTRMSRRSRVGTTMALLLTMVLVVGLRANQPVSGTTDGVASEPGPAQASQPLSLDWVPNGSLFVVAIKPAAFLEHPALKESVGDVQKLAAESGLSLSDIDSITLFTTDARNPGPGAAIFRSRRATDWAAMRKQYPNAKESRLYGTTVYGTRSSTYFMPDDHTLVLGDAKAMADVVRAGKRGTSNRFWHEQWKALADKPAAFLFDLGALREQNQHGDALADRAVGAGAPPRRAAPRIAGGGLYDATAPLWEKGELFAASLTPGESLALNAVLTTLSEDDASKAKDTAQAGVVLLGNMLSQMQRSMARSREPEAGLVTDLLTVAEQAVRGATIEREGSSVVVAATAPWADVARMTRDLLPTVARARTRARGAMNSNNLKQLAIAMHNYHDAYGAFPPAYSMGRDGKGKHPVSWRVLLTPFLERADIFQNYRFDEPWNSAHNQRVTAEMPPVFGHPAGPAGRQETAYFAVISTHQRLKTGFGRHSSNKIREFLDGTSNTLLIVEANRRVHWAKPDDIEWNPEAELPKFGGFAEPGFSAARADGSVSHFNESLDPAELRKMLTINDGKPLKARVR